MINHWKPRVFSTGIFYLFILNLSEAVWDLAYHASRSDTTHWLVYSRYNIYIYKHSKEPSLIICECSLSNLSWTEVVAGSISEKKSLNIVRKKWIQTENSTVNYVVSPLTQKPVDVEWIADHWFCVRSTWFSVWSRTSARQMLPGGSGPEGSAVFLEHCHQEFHLNRPALRPHAIPLRKISLTTSRSCRPINN